MNILMYMVPLALMLGTIGLAAFFWAMRHQQFEDLDGAAYRILQDGEE